MVLQLTAHPTNPSFWAPIKTLTLIRIDRSEAQETVKNLKESEEKYDLSKLQMRKIINEVGETKKYNEADKYFLGEIQ